MQSSRISQIGCFGLILVIILLVLIGTVAARHDISNKRAAAIAVYERMAEQVEKAPGVLSRMLAFDCGDAASEAVDSLEVSVAEFSALDEPSIPTLKLMWGQVEDTWEAVNRGCAGHLGESAFRDLTVEMEGLRNRYSVEMGNFEEVSQIYNSALDSFPGTLVATDFKQLEGS